MSEKPTLALLIEHQDVSSYWSLSLADRRTVEHAYIELLRAQLPLSIQQQWQDPTQLPIQPQPIYPPAPTPTSYTFGSIQYLLETEVLRLGNDFSLAKEVRSSCRYCNPYHCDRLCRQIERNSAPWVLQVEYDGKLYTANVWLEFEFPSTS